MMPRHINKIYDLIAVCLLVVSLALVPINIRAQSVGFIPVGMEHLEPFLDLQDLIREFDHSLNSHWGFHRFCNPTGLAAIIYKAKLQYLEDLKALLPSAASVLEELRFNCTETFTKKLVYSLPIGSIGHTVATFAFVSYLLDYWEKLDIKEKPSRKVRCGLLVAPLWLRMWSETMRSRMRELENMRYFRWGIYQALGMRSTSMRSRSFKLMNPIKEEDQQILVNNLEEEDKKEELLRMTFDQMDSTMKEDCSMETNSLVAQEVD